MKRTGTFLADCLMFLALTVAAAACAGTVPGPKQDPDWVKQPSGQSTDWDLYEDSQGGGR